MANYSWVDLSTIPWYDSDGMRYDDPCQGHKAANCALFAALTSIAWVQPDPFRGFLNPPKIGKYRYFKLYQLIPGASPSPKVYYVDSQVCLDNGEFIFGRSKNPNGEIWPAIWEKAYAALKSNIASGTKIEANLDMDNIEWGGNAFKSLQEMTGSMSGYTKETSNSLLEEIYADIASVCDDCTTNSYKVIGPNKLVAWTYPDQSYTWDSQIVASHNYSILGYYICANGTTTGDTVYIVLRNPWGTCNATPDPDNPTQNMTWCQFALDGANGTLAIKIKDFKQAFEAYGCVS
jgi:hypothetical protein